MHRIAWLVLLAACRIGFDELHPDGGEGSTGTGDAHVETGQPDEPFTGTCQPGTQCSFDCSLASECSVQCNGGTCDVTCPATGCVVTGCYVGTCTVECATGSPTVYPSLATCP